MAKNPLTVEALKHDSATRRNIPTAEYESVMRADEKAPVQLAYERRNRDLDPQLVWRGKDEQDWSALIVQAPPLYIQEKVHPKAIIDELKRESQARREEAEPLAPDLFADFNGLKDKEAATEFYSHDQHWSNRMISGDSLSVMASLAEREGLRGKVQCIYFDPPYGIRFNSNFQWSTTSRDVKDGAKDHLTREPEQVRAFRDTWKDGIHSYLTYLRDRLTVARDLLHESGSIFVQIGDENVHRVRALMDEVFGERNFVALITVEKTSAQTTDLLSSSTDYVIFFCRDISRAKFRRALSAKEPTDSMMGEYASYQDEMLCRHQIPRSITASEWSEIEKKFKIFSKDNTTSNRPPGSFPVPFRGRSYTPGNGFWKTGEIGFSRLIKADRIETRGSALRYVRYFRDYSASPINNIWSDVKFSSRREDKSYVVQSSTLLVQRCVLMSTDPGDLVLDPTCGSGTTAYVAEQWGRRWITIDTSRVAVALARSRLMGARYPYYVLADSKEGQRKEGEISSVPPRLSSTLSDVRHGFVYERVPHIMLKDISNNAEIDVIWEKWQATLEPLRAALTAALGASWEEWEIPREAASGWPQDVVDTHAQWWEARIARQKEIDASIAAKAEFEYLYDKPYTDNTKVRVAGPFTVESLSPHRTLAVDWDDELIDVLEAADGKRKAVERDQSLHDFAHMIIENLKTAGVQQAHKEDRISFTSLVGWPGEFICAEGTYVEGDKRKRAGIFIGPEFGTVSRPDLVAAAREAGDAGFDVLIACAFNYDAHSAEFDKLGRVPVLKARMNPDLHMGGDLKATGAGNLFVIFGEPDIKILDAADGMKQVKVFGVDVFKPQTGEVISEGTDGIALWMLDTDYNEESFFVRHAYFLGANDPYKALKTTLKAEIDQEAWESLNSDISRPFPKPKSGRIAVKVINHLGDEVMKVFAVI
ncbi:DNA methylase [Bosea sp. Root381]|uniref:site-specific DNA-methyltransferase n=1 Tax=Bosea sp. Root381 TaxID=1736524 RepID=UPI0006FC464B|nr:site-specific DNA-methyltransferase [Bosea sp. Root381]KRE09490.1 DNA methylase [Bosea sp. Root381]